MAALNSKPHALFLVLISSALTFVAMVLLARSGHLHIVSSIQEHIYKEYPLTTGANCHCPKPKECIEPPPSRKLFPKKFAEVPNLRFQGTSADDARKIDWESQLLTPNGGFLMVEEWDYKVQGYGVSMFHQLHCLTMIRTMLLGGEMSTAHEAKGNEWKADPLHFLHCLDYMAQAILCAADDTLEKPTKTMNWKGNEVEGIDGMGHTHQCRNATMLHERVLGSELSPVKAASIGRDTVFP
ncbi:unnamed protein product [Alternaria sp. RS040]